MQDQERLEKQRYWDELARQLGLGPEEGTAAASSTTTSHVGKSSLPATPLSETAESSTDTHRHSKTSSTASPFAEKRDESRRGRGKGRRRNETTANESTYASTEQVVESEPTSSRRGLVADGSATSDEPGEPPRSRRRRSRRQSEPAESAESSLEAISDDSQPDTSTDAEQPDKEPGRGRRRRRARKSRESIADSSGEETADEVSAVASEPNNEEDEDEGDSLSDWNVPSWQELIASLYRPDR